MAFWLTIQSIDVIVKNLKKDLNNQLFKEIILLSFTFTGMANSKTKQLAKTIQFLAF